jgi:hypothetical protein
MSELLKHAIHELDLIGAGDKDADYDGNLKVSVLGIVEAFSKQGHSGLSASLTVAMVEKLLRFQPLSPLTGAEDEWIPIDPAYRTPRLAEQNRRCSSVFRRDDGTAFDIKGRMFREPDGTTYLDQRSSVDVTFPYEPATEIVDMPA